MNKKTVLQTISLHMMVEAKYLVNLARQAYWFEDNERWAVNLLKSFQGITDKQINKIINAEATMDGWSVCDKKYCSQCKDLEDCHYLEEVDNKFQLEILKRKLWLNETQYKFDQYHYDKQRVTEYIQVSLGFYSHDSDDLQNQLHQIEKSFWTANAYKYPSPSTIDNISENEKDYTRKTNEFINILSRWSQNNTNTDPEIFLKQFLVIKEPLIEKLELKPQRANGCILITVEHPKTGKKIYYNLRKEYYILYINSRVSSIRRQKITLSQDIDSDKVKERLTEIEKRVGYAHLEMMHSMGLKHSDSGYYSHDVIECYVNALLQWYMYEITIHNDTGTIKKLPNKLSLINRNAYINDKLKEKKIDMR